VLVSKYAWHLPLYRQAQILLAQGIEIDRSVLAFWVGYAAAELMPLWRHLREILLGSPRLFVDETRAPVLDPGRGRTKSDYFWSIARDDSAWRGGTGPPAVVYTYAPGRGAEHAMTLLAGYRGIVQCDGYAAYKQVAHRGRAGNAVILAFCWAHYLESGFIWRGGPAGQRSRVATGAGTPDNSCLRVVIRRRAGEGRCSFRSEHCRVSTCTSGTGNGATRDCRAAPCTRRVAARLPVMEVTPGRRHEGCGSPGGTALRAAERSASCRTSWPPGCLACSLRSNTASPSHRRPRAWRPLPMRSADPMSACPARSVGYAGAFERSERFLRMWRWRR
jgi:hypothetical protein